MTKQNRKILFIVYAFTGLLTESFIFYLFPYTGLGGVICFPISILLSVLFGWTLYKLTKQFFAPLLVGILFLLFIAIQFEIELQVHPQDFGGSPLQQIADCKSAYTFYDSINFDSYPQLGRAKRVAYIYKFKNKLPSSISTLSIDSLLEDYSSKFNRKYMFLNYTHDTTYDTNSLTLTRTDTSLIIIENPKDSSKVNVHITDKYLLDHPGGGIYDRENSIIYNVSLDKFELNTGLEELFYKYLSMTKKPAGSSSLLP